MSQIQTQGGVLSNQTLATMSVPDVPASPVIQYSKTTLTAAQVLAMNGAPITILPAPGAGLVNVILDALFFLNAGSSAFASGGLVSVRQNAIALCTTSAALVNNASPISIQPAFPGIGTTQSNGAANALTDITNATGAFTGGAGATLDIHLWYCTILG